MSAASMCKFARSVHRHRARLAACPALVSLAFAGGALAQSNQDAAGFFVRGQFTYDDNLFRLPSDTGTLGAPLPQDLETADYVSRAVLGFAEQMHFGRQSLRVDLRADAVRFDRNDHLDHTAGRGRLAWNWRALGRLSGTLAADYRRGLADFANVRTATEAELFKDMLETVDYSGEARVALGPRWALLGGLRRIETEHSAAQRRFDDFEANTAHAGVEYTTPADHRVALAYRFTEAQFPNLAALEQASYRREYEQSMLLARTRYVATVRTAFDVEYGYTRRRHPDGTPGEFSGNTWRAQIEWEPRVKFGTTLAAWREIKAYADAESDYFISDGFSIEPAWSPVRSLTFSMELSWEELDFLGSNPLLVEDQGRADTLRSVQANIVYSPRDHLRFDLSWRYIERDSNRPRSIYDANVATAAVQWRFL